MGRRETASGRKPAKAERKPVRKSAPRDEPMTADDILDMQSGMLEDGYSFETNVPKSGKSADQIALKLYWYDKKKDKRVWVGMAVGEKLEHAWEQVEDVLDKFEGDDGDDEDEDDEDEDEEEEPDHEMDVVDGRPARVPARRGRRR